MNLIEWSEWENSEKFAIELLQQLGYSYINGNEVVPSSQDPYRTSFRDVILSKILDTKIKEFNPWISDFNIKQLRRKFFFPSNELINPNKTFWEFITHKDKLCVEQDLGDGKGRRNQAVQIIDWDTPSNNHFLIANQFKVHSSKGNKRPDLVIFINGIPLVVIECKSPLIANPLTQGIQQVRGYQDTITRLFHFNQIIIITAGQTARYGVINNKLEHFMDWKEPINFDLVKKEDDIKQVVSMSRVELEELVKKTGRRTITPTPQDSLLYSLCRPVNLLDIIRNFTVFEKHRVHGLIKKICRYQQFRATNRTLLKIKHSKERGGTIWHTQGSGKSLTMLFTAIKLRRDPMFENPLLLFITDRIDLRRQLKGVFEDCGFPNVVRPGSASDLQATIRNGQGVTIVTNIHLFRENDAETEEENGQSELDEEAIAERFPELNASENVFIMVDEAHRTQYKRYGLRMRKALPNAFYLAFTGTPLARNEKNAKITVGKGKTVRKFGPFIDVYDIRQAVLDGATVQIMYENRLTELHLEGPTIDELFNAIFSDKTAKEREGIKKKFATKNNLLLAKERVKRVCLDLKGHYEKHIQPNNFKAQLVVQSQLATLLYKKYLDMFKAPESAIIISDTPDIDKYIEEKGEIDELKKIKALTNKKDQDDAIDRFKDPADPLKILIVCDMLITGFDAPVEQVMYLDKPLKEHNLLQAIARVNRTADGKTYGLIVDYYGISLRLQEALDIFDVEDVDGVWVDLKSELRRLEQHYKQVMSHFDGLDKSDLEAVVNALEPEDKRSDFFADFRTFTQSLDVVLPDPAAEPYLGDLKYLEKVVRALRTRTYDEELDITGCGGKVRQLLDEYIRSTVVEQLVEPVPILSDKFDDEINKFKSPKAKASQMEHAIRKEITLKLEEDPVFYKSLRDRLEELIEKYRQERIDMAEQLKQLQSFIREIRERPDVARDLGLSQSELAFFNLLKNDLETTGIAEARAIVAVTYGILESIEPLISLVDWQRKNDVLRQIRLLSKNSLKSNTNIEKERRESLAQEIVNLAKVHYTT